MKKEFLAALIQMNSGTDTERNFARAEELVWEAAEGGADFVMLPETFDYIGADIKRHEQKGDNRIRTVFGYLAKKYHIWIQCGSITLANESKTDERPTNTAFLISPEGEVFSRYDKIHMFEINDEENAVVSESRTVCPGDRLVVTETDLAVFGFAICYDLRFPGMFRQMAKGGASVFLVPANFTRNTGKAHWEVLLRARAIENTCYLFACNQCGDKYPFNSYGHSMIVDPWGEILAEAGEEEEVIFAKIDLNRIEEVRRKMPSLAYEEKRINKS